jgi:rubrerythrin
VSDTAKARARVPSTLDEFMALALAMEAAAADRYAELADTMQAHNNTETAELFRRMAAIEARHAREIRAQIGERGIEATRRWEAANAAEAECAPTESLHYLMLPWHALMIALENERRAEQFFAQLAKVATSDAVREAAERLCAEEREHVALIEAWLAKVPPPQTDWADDPDPPHHLD